jgi:maleate cis-trans isomerase
VTRLAVASRWATQLNEALKQFLEHAGFEVVSMTSVGQWAAEAFGMSIETGVKLAIQLGREAMRKAPNAQGLLLPGGTWRSLAVIPCLEEDFGKPVFTNPTGSVWRLIHDGVAPPVQGWGKVLETP